jgi:hypothetical protein
MAVEIIFFASSAFIVSYLFFRVLPITLYKNIGFATSGYNLLFYVLGNHPSRTALQDGRI